MKNLLRPDEAAGRLNISKRSVYRLVAEGQLVGLYVRSVLRIQADSIDGYVKRQIMRYKLEAAE